MATTAIESMQVVWVDPTTKQAGGTIHLSTTELDTVNNSVYSLKQLVAAKLGVENSAKLDLKLYGQSLPQGPLASYLPLLRTNAPRFALSYSQTKLTLKLFVKTIRGRTIRLDVNPNETIQDVKQRFEEKEGLPVADNRLVYGGVELADHCRVFHYNIPPNATLMSLGRLVGGSHIRMGSLTTALPCKGLKFADVSNEDMMEVIEFSPSVPAWRIVCRGLNLSGQCTNPDCVACSKWVYMQVGFRPANLFTYQAHCPMCRQSVVPKTCGFYSCQWRFEGIKLHSDVHMSSGWKKAEGEVYHAFKSQESNLVLWESLLVIPHPLAVKECAVCCEVLGINGLATLPCQHQIHRVCLNEWTTTCKGRNASVSCPLCRSAVP
ncbi:hypothetical protein AeNC1_003750 [Aphanomyces euteiches]|nr:hypothetical protein AeNC1_003750 [Aphanomyces euteiches]